MRLPPLVLSLAFSLAVARALVLLALVLR